MIITCYLNRGGVRGLGLPIFDVRCINFHKPPQEGLPFSSIHVLEGLLSIPLLCCQEPPVQGVGHLDGRIPQCQVVLCCCPFSSSSSVLVPHPLSLSSLVVLAPLPASSSSSLSLLKSTPPLLSARNASNHKVDCYIKKRGCH